MSKKSLTHLSATLVGALGESGLGICRWWQLTGIPQEGPFGPIVQLLLISGAVYDGGDRLTTDLQRDLRSMAGLSWAFFSLQAIRGPSAPHHAAFSLQGQDAVLSEPRACLPTISVSGSSPLP
jgi:hypothetical protein